MAKKPAGKAAKTAGTPSVAKPDLAEVRAQIDGIDRRIQELIAERANWAQQVGKAKGKLAAAVDYYRPEREAQVLRRVVDRNDGPLADEVLVRLFREVMSACLAQQEPLKIGYLGPEGTFSQQAAHKHFGHSAHGLPMASIEEVFQEVAADARSRMNVPFFLHDPALDAAFLSEAKQAGLVALKGHRVLGGMRASLYNAMPEAGVQALVDFMREFQQAHG